MLEERRWLTSTGDEHPGVLAWSCPPDGLHVEPQPEWMAFTGQSAEEMLGDGWTRAVHPEDLAEAGARWTRAVERGEPFVNEHRIRRHDGQWRWMLVRGTPVRDASGAIVEWRGLHVDVTERRRAEEALRQRNRQLDLLVRAHQTLLTVAGNPATALDTVLASMADLLGVESYYYYQLSADSEWLELTLARGVGDEERRLFGRIRFGTLLCGRVAETQQRLVVEDLQHCTEPGSEALRGAGATSYAGFPLVTGGRLIGSIAFVSRRLTHFRDGEIQAIQATCDQIAAALERNRLMEALQASEARLTLALEAGRAGTWESVPATGEFIASAEARRLHGVRAGAPLTQEAVLAAVFPEDRPRVEAAIRRSLATGEPLALDLRSGQPDGTIRWLHSQAEVRRDGPHPRLVGLVQDITPHKQAEEELRASEVRLASEVQAFARLHELSSRLWRTERLQEGLDEMLAATIELLGADMGNVQLLDSERGVLTIEVSHGFDQPFLELFREVTTADASACGRALRAGQRVVIDDVETDAPYAPFREAARVAGYRAVQSTPLIGRDGQCHGVLSTHWRTPHRPSDRDLRRLDLYVRQATDFVERCRIEGELHESEGRFRQVAESLPQLIWTCAVDGTCDYLSPQWERYTGIPAKEQLAFGWLEQVHPDDRQRVVDRWQTTVREGGQLDIEFRIRRHDGMYRWFRTLAIPLHDEAGSIVKWFGSNTDIDELIQVQAALKQADRRKDEFLATLGHELRNPLAPIRNAARVLSLQAQPQPADRRLLDIILRQVGHLVRLVDDLLDISRIDRDKLELHQEPVALQQVLSDALDGCRGILESKGHHVDLRVPEEPLWIFGDPVRLTQIATNIVNNAAKYTPAGGRIAVEAMREGNDAVFRVRDNGVGISTEMLPRVFDLFAQSPGHIRLAEGGLGIGLALVRKLVQLHGGRVEARSAGLGRGSEFVVRLPASPERLATPAVSDAGAAPAVTRPVRVTIIDDDHDVAESFAALLECSGVEVQVANDGPAGIALVQEFEPELIFLDIGMPGMDGYETARRIRQLPSRQRFTLVALTGWGQENDRRRATEAGFDHHLTKPAPLKKVEAILKDVTGLAPSASGVT